MDFGQCSVLPGFIDSHLHMYNLGVSLRSVQLHGANSIAECIERGKKYIKDYNPPKNTVISGRGWNDDYFLDERRMLTRRDLDLISTEYPIVFTRACGHALTANTRAIELAGVTKDTPQPDGGQFEIGEDGLPNGIFKENASAYIKTVSYTHLVQLPPNPRRMWRQPFFNASAISCPTPYVVVFPGFSFPCLLYTSLGWWSTRIPTAIPRVPRYSGFS